MHKLCKLGPWSKGAISTLLVLQWCTNLHRPPKQLSVPFCSHLRYLPPPPIVYGTLLRITHCLQGAINWVCVDEDISIRELFVGGRGCEHEFGLSSPLYTSYPSDFRRLSLPLWRTVGRVFSWKMRPQIRTVKPRITFSFLNLYG